MTGGTVGRPRCGANHDAATLRAPLPQFVQRSSVRAVSTIGFTRYGKPTPRPGDACKAGQIRSSANGSRRQHCGSWRRSRTLSDRPECPVLFPVHTLLAHRRRLRNWRDARPQRIREWSLAFGLACLTAVAPKVCELLETAEQDLIAFYQLPSGTEPSSARRTRSSGSTTRSAAGPTSLGSSPTTPP
jgi:hypothetical protein